LGCDVDHDIAEEEPRFHCRDGKSGTAKALERKP